MLYTEFVSEYCQDILEDFTRKGKEGEFDLGNNEMYPYDTIKVDSDGKEVKVILDEEGNQIPVEDIIRHNLAEFLRIYPNSEQAYNRYISLFDIKVGLDALMELRENMRKEQERMKLLEKGVLDDFDI